MIDRLKLLERVKKGENFFDTKGHKNKVKLLQSLTLFFEIIFRIKKQKHRLPLKKNLFNLPVYGGF